MRRDPDEIDVFQIERTVWIAEAKTGLPVYDFPFEQLMACRHSLFGLDEVQAIGRFGAVEDYDALYHSLLERGIRLIHTPEQHELCSELPLWYPRLEGLTPKSWWFDLAPEPSVAGALAGWPMFLKGSRQTSRHNAKLSIVANEEAYRFAASAFRNDHILHWQQFVIRRMEKLRSLKADMGTKIPASFEFRTFWWQGQLAGAGPYFIEFSDYQWNEKERHDALEIAEEAARRLSLPFLVVDVAQCEDGTWVVIEVNDGQESGYTGAHPLPLWQTIVDLERSRV